MRIKSTRPLPSERTPALLRCARRALQAAGRRTCWVAGRASRPPCWTQVESGVLPRPPLGAAPACLSALPALPVRGFSQAFGRPLVSLHLSGPKLTAATRVGAGSGSSRVVLLPDDSQ